MSLRSLWTFLGRKDVRSFVLGFIVATLLILPMTFSGQPSLLSGSIMYSEDTVRYNATYEALFEEIGEAKAGDFFLARYVHITAAIGIIVQITFDNKTVTIHRFAVFLIEDNAYQILIDRSENNETFAEGLNIVEYGEYGFIVFAHTNEGTGLLNMEITVMHDG